MHSKMGLILSQVNSTPSSHAVYVWQNYVQKAGAKHIAIMAHSYGGVVTIDLVSERFEPFIFMLFNITYTYLPNFDLCRGSS